MPAATTVPDMPDTTIVTGKTTPLSRVLSLLRLGLHIMFTFLLTFGLFRFVDDDPGRITGTPVVPWVLFLAAVYFLGTLWENAYATGRTLISPSRFAPWWLALITLLWHGLVALSINFVWLLFPLVLLFCHLLPRVPGLIAAVILWGIAAFVPGYLHPEQWAAGSVIGPAIGTILAVVIYYSYRALHREADHHRVVAEQLKATQEELIAAEHQAGRLEERERLSREIHDTVAQGLSSILLVARAAQRSLTQGDHDTTAGQLTTIEEVAADNLAEARRFVRDLAAPATDSSLPQALQQIINKTIARQRALGDDLVIKLNLVGNTAQVIPEPVSTTVVRATQEALANVVKHAHASLVVVTLQVWDSMIALDVVDDGRSFDGEYGYGLRGLQSRVANLGGDLVVETGEGTNNGVRNNTRNGTALAVRIPLTSEREKTP